MDVLRTLHAILAPDSTPAIRSRPPVPAKEVSAGSRTFAQTLREAALGEDSAIAAFGVQLPRQAIIDPTAKPRPIAMPEAPEDSLGPLGGVVPPGPATELPIDTLHIETRDPLGALALEQPPNRATRPPMPIPWPGRVLGPSGATGPGIQTTQAAVDQSLAIKFAQYTDPAGQGVSDIGHEGRLFLDAVENGYVSNTPEGLGTMLAYLSMGDVRPDGSLTGRPAGISQYFVDWFTAGATAANV